MAPPRRSTARRVPPAAPEPRLPGPATPASVAATAPRDNTQGAGARGFYDPGAGAATESPAATSGLAAAAAADPGAFNDSVRRDHQGEGEHGGTADRAVVERAVAEEIDSPAALAAEIERIRGFRRPLGAFSQKLALAKRPGYHRHWFNDVAGRIDEATQNGWAHVQGKDRKPIARCVGSGRDKGALYAFAMEIPEVFWLEDQSAKHRVAEERIESLKGAGAFRAPPGGAEKSDKGKFYDPVDASEGPLTIRKG